MDAKSPQPIYDDSLSVRELVHVLRRGKVLYISLTLAFAVVAGVAGKLAPKKYTAATVVSPVLESPGGNQLGGGISSLMSQFGGLASLAGLSVSGDTRRQETLAVLQSQALTERYIQENNLLPILFANKWDEQNKRWKTTDPQKTPTLWKGNEFFKKRVRTLSGDTKPGLVTLSITWTDPHLAARWANDLVRETNGYLRAKAIDESERNIAYLQDQASKTDVVGVKQAIYTIMQSEINKAMLARGSAEYALKVLDPALPPELPSSLGGTMWGLIGLFSGLLLSVLIAFARLMWVGSGGAVRD